MTMRRAGVFLALFQAGLLLLNYLLVPMSLGLLWYHLSSWKPMGLMQGDRRGVLIGNLG